MGLMGWQTSALTRSLSLSVSFLNPSLFIGLHLWLFFIHLYLFDCAQGLKNNITCVFSINRISTLWELADYSCVLLTWLLRIFRAISNSVAFE